MQQRSNGRAPDRIYGVIIEETVPRWIKEQSVTGGWVMAEYSMLPTPPLLERSATPQKANSTAVARKFVATVDGDSVEVPGSGQEATLGRKVIGDLIAVQRAILARLMVTSA